MTAPVLLKYVISVFPLEAHKSYRGNGYFLFLLAYEKSLEPFNDLVKEINDSVDDGLEEGGLFYYGRSLCAGRLDFNSCLLVAANCTFSVSVAYFCLCGLLIDYVLEGMLTDVRLVAALALLPVNESICVNP